MVDVVCARTGEEEADARAGGGGRAGFYVDHPAVREVLPDLRAIADETLSAQRLILMGVRIAGGDEGA